MADIIHRVGIKAPITKVYEALATVEGISRWWTEETTGKSQVGGTVQFRFVDHGQEKGRMVADVVALAPDKKVQWHFTSGPEEWIGTDVVFNLSQDGDYTIVLFNHRNWKEAVEFMAHCSMKWGVFLMSLKEFAETGKGKPAPHDIKIDNWN